ncbi:hypothetical protein LGM89_16210 [Burkholderia sp. AU31624]|uniref:hypothetical protein n=1 Tax=Burkholderia sp. AU31624 TaxID=2879629 RepID=UPI001CF2CFC9|nr:hypothetical protein [Burkholderia sp. AU31624]MCA8254818.1 hypothetical protein [Burkholderia sp. AU31624]
MADVLVETLRAIAPDVKPETALKHFLDVHFQGGVVGTTGTGPIAFEPQQHPDFGMYYARRREESGTGLILVDVFRRETDHKG